MPASGDLSRVSAVDPGDTVLHVLHVALGAPADRLLRSVAHQRGLGWRVEVAGPGRLRRPGELDAVDVVVLHGRRAGWLGRVLLRGRRATALAPRPGQWAPRGVPLLVERLLASWADVVMTDPSDVRTGARVWVPPFEVGTDDVQAAVLMRCHAYGRPSAGLGRT